jgi:hypothetical protein
LNQNAVQIRNNWLEFIKSHSKYDWLKDSFSGLIPEPVGDIAIYDIVDSADSCKKDGGLHFKSIPASYFTSNLPAKDDFTALIGYNDSKRPINVLFDEFAINYPFLAIKPKEIEEKSLILKEICKN